VQSLVKKPEQKSLPDNKMNDFELIANEFIKNVRFVPFKN
jgi:hypothetical protein